MKLFEFQAKELLQSHGLSIPKGHVIHDDNYAELSFPSFIKAQVLEGQRGKRGLIKKVFSSEGINQFITNNKGVPFFLVEEDIDHDQEFFISITYDPITRNPVLLFSSTGGISVEESAVSRFPLDILSPDFSLFHAFLNDNYSLYSLSILETVKQLFSLFLKYDLLLLEINPLIITNGNPIILDAKLEIDDNALFRQQELVEKYDTRTCSLTDREQAARIIDEKDTRGVAGKSYLDLDGDIAILASGGGASLAALDILMDAGGKPANYVEYSGNPPREKVKQLTAITMSKKNLAGCWIVGGIANFTDIYETLQGVIDGILELPEKPRYPIVIRRAGPNDDKARQFIQEIKDKHGLDIHFFDERTSIGESAKEIMKLSQQFTEVQHAHTDQ